MEICFIEKYIYLCNIVFFWKILLQEINRDNMKYLIVGGVAGGATAAARLRRNDEQAEIILFEKGKYISYANCGLPYYIGGIIQDREKLFVQTPEIFGKRFNLDVRTESEVISVDLGQKRVLVRNGKGEEYAESYDKLLLSPGAIPVRPPLPGIDSEGIFTLRNVDDTDDIKKFLQTRDVKKAVVVGGGFIGLEMAENLWHNNIRVFVIEMADQVMTPVDYSTAAIIHEHLRQKGVDLLLNESVISVERTASGLKVNFKSGRVIDTDMVILSIGVRPNNSLAVSAGLKFGERGGIVVDKFLRTSDESVYAVGDVIGYPSLASAAYDQGRIAAQALVKGEATAHLIEDIPTGIYTIPEISSVGKTEQQLTAMKVPYEVGRAQFKHLARAQIVGMSVGTLKILFHRETKEILGIHCFGERAAEIIHIGQAIMEQKGGGNTIEYFVNTTFNYPTMAEAYRVAALNGLNRLF